MQQHPLNNLQAAWYQAKHGAQAYYCPPHEWMSSGKAGLRIFAHLQYCTQTAINSAKGAVRCKVCHPMHAVQRRDAKACELMLHRGARCNWFSRCCSNFAVHLGAAAIAAPPGNTAAAVGGGDPCDLGVACGRSCAALYCASSVLSICSVMA